MSDKKIVKDPKYYMEATCRRPWESYVPPIKMGEGVYYISGNDWVACYLIETNNGLILIDTAMHESLYLLIENIRILGHKLTDIKKILISHAHIDHMGGTRALQELTKAEIYIGKRDLLFLEERTDLLANEDGLYTCGEVIPDEFYSDEKPIILGDLKIYTVSTPGHTPGTTSFFFKKEDKNGKIFKYGLHGGIGSNTLTKDYFNRTGLPHTLRDEYISSLLKLRDMHVDICLPSHTNQAPLLELVDEISESNNPYVNPNVWNQLIEKRLDDIYKIIDQEKSYK